LHQGVQHGARDGLGVRVKAAEDVVEAGARGIEQAVLDELNAQATGDATRGDGVASSHGLALGVGLPPTL